MIFFVPETKSYQTSASYDLFPQHCIILTLTNKEHNKTVTKEWIESIQHLKTKPKKKAIQDIKKQSMLSSTVVRYQKQRVRS